MTEFNWKAGDEVLVVKTGVANVASMLAGLRRAGATPVLVEDGERLLEAPRVVVPGVGAFGTAMKALHDMKLADVLVERITKRLPTMTVCLGLQILGHASEESPGVEGLGVVDASATRFTGDIRVPQLGWNYVRADNDTRFLRDGYVYFANSYRWTEVGGEWLCARGEYAGSFVGAVESGGVLACQFHPELSGRYGHELIVRWLENGGVSC